MLACGPEFLNVFIESKLNDLSLQKVRLYIDNYPYHGVAFDPDERLELCSQLVEVLEITSKKTKDRNVLRAQEAVLEWQHVFWDSQVFLLLFLLTLLPLCFLFLSWGQFPLWSRPSSSSSGSLPVLLHLLFHRDISHTSSEHHDLISVDSKHHANTYVKVVLAEPVERSFGFWDRASPDINPLKGTGCTRKNLTLTDAKQRGRACLTSNKRALLAYLQAGVVTQMCSRAGTNLFEFPFQVLNVRVEGDL